MKGSSPQKRTDTVACSAGGRGSLSPSSVLVARASDRLAKHIKATHVTNPLEFCDLCLFLARSIDCAIANNEVPLKAPDLPLLLKQVYVRKNASLQAVMVLMISVKCACEIGWFPDKDADDLLILAKEIGKNFCSMDNINIEHRNGLPCIAEIMSRFYPWINIGNILASLEVKPGYGAFVTDFHIPRSMMAPVQEQICLFVAQTDNLDASSCIVTPPQVNFLLNGKGVQGRINVSLVNGPQLPTNVTAMVRCGINLLQAVGQFNGHYIIVIAFMSMISSSDTPVLQDYVQPVVAALDPDSEIKEGPSRISLNCPISHRRIRTPVKGHLCKHHQCFDYENFMEMNFRMPFWRCPHCNQSVCYPDIRIDQNIVKVLKEVDENVVEVIISTDGSWKVVLESKNHPNQTYGETQSCQQKGSEQCESVGFSNIPANVVDLTIRGDSDTAGVSISGSEEMNPVLDNRQGCSTAENLVPPEVNNTVRADQNASPQIVDDFWSGILLATATAQYGLTVPATISDAHIDAGISDTPAFNIMHSPVLTDVSPVLNQESVDVHGEAQLRISSPRNKFFDPSNLQLLESRSESLIASNGLGRLPSLPRNVSSTLGGFQAHLAQAPGPSSSLQTRALNSSMPSIASSPMSQRTHSLAPYSDGFDAVNGCTEGDQQFPRPLMNSFPVSNLASSSTQHHSVTQNWIGRDCQHVSGKSAQQGVGNPSQGPAAHSIPSTPPFLQNPNRSPLNWSTVYAMTESQNTVHPSSHVQSVQIQQRGGGGDQATGDVSNKQPLHRASAQQTAPIVRTPPSVPVQLQPSGKSTAFSINMVAERLKIAGEQRQKTGGTTPPTSRAEGSAALASEKNWQPSGRMRGSLTGEAYSAALSQFRIQPIQPPQDCQSPSNQE